MVYLSVSAARRGFNGINPNTIIDNYSLCGTSAAAMIKKLKLLYEHQTIYIYCKITAYEPGKPMQAICNFETSPTNELKRKYYVAENLYGVTQRTFEE